MTNISTMRMSKPAPPVSSAECACGCGETVTPGSRYRQHHNIRLLAADRYRTTAEDVLNPDSTLQLSEEHGLLLWQLTDGRHHYRTCRVQGCTQCAADQTWVMSTAAWGLYAFHTICEYLNIDDGATRQWFFATAK